MFVTDEVYSAGAGINKRHKIPHGPELHEILSCQRNVERLFDFGEKRGHIRGWYSGITQLRVKIWGAIEVQMLVDQLSETVFR